MMDTVISQQDVQLSLHPLALNITITNTTLIRQNKHRAVDRLLWPYSSIFWFVPPESVPVPQVCVLCSSAGKPVLAMHDGCYQRDG